jgi:hypothetical protein
VVVVDAAQRPRVLVAPREGGWGVPEWEVDEAPTRSPDLGRILGQVRERLGLEVGVLRYVEAHEDEATRRRSGTWVMERRGEGRGGGKWVTRAELEVEGDATARFAAEVLRELEDGRAPANRQAWSFPGWLNEAERWMRERLRAIAREPTGLIEQVRNNSISSVLRAHTAEGDVYLKAASPHFRHEARITRGLAGRFPEHLPRMLAADEERSWMLLEDFSPLLRGAPLETWQETLLIAGELQRRCVGEEDWLFSIGCADRRLAVLRDQIPVLVDAPEVRAELDEALRRKLVARVSELQAMCDELAGCGVPETLIHGDLHGGNVARGGGRVTIFDWTDGAVGHPFLDLVTFLPTERRKPPGVDDAKAAARRLTDAYLEGWTTFASPAQLRRAIELLKAVGQLHHAQSYLQILRSLEPADYWQWEGELREWLTEVADPTRKMKDIFPE